jgi:hypothetical protein
VEAIFLFLFLFRLPATCAGRRCGYYFTLKHFLYFCLHFSSYLRRELVEDVEITLALLLPHHTRLFQQIRVNLGASERKPLVEVNVDVLAWGRVHGLGVRGFQG